VRRVRKKLIIAVAINGKVETIGEIFVILRSEAKSHGVEVIQGDLVKFRGIFGEGSGAEIGSSRIHGEMLVATLELRADVYAFVAIFRF